MIWNRQIFFAQNNRVTQKMRVLTIEMLAFWNDPLSITVHPSTSVLIQFSLFLSQIEPEPKIQLSGFAAYFILMTPLAHAALAANQKTAKIAVKQKSCKEIDVSFYSMINEGVGFFCRRLTTIGAFFCSDMYKSEKKTQTARLTIVPKKEMTPTKTKNWASEEKSPGRYIWNFWVLQLALMAGS